MIDFRTIATKITVTKIVTVDQNNVRHRKIDDIKPGGLGTFFIQQIMDAVVFKEGEKPWINHLVLTKKI